MVRRTCAKMRFAEVPYIDLASLKRSVSGGNRRLQDEEVASASSTFQSCGSRIRGFRRYSRLCNCQIFQLPLPRVTIPEASYYAHHLIAVNGCCLLLRKSVDLHVLVNS